MIPNEKHWFSSSRALSHCHTSLQDVISRDEDLATPSAAVAVVQKHIFVVLVCGQQSLEDLVQETQITVHLASAFLLETLLAPQRAWWRCKLSSRHRP